MKDSSLAYAIACILFVSALATGIMSIRYYYTLRGIAKIQYDVARINQNRKMIQSLVAHALAYAKTNPEITPILENYDIRQGTNQPAESGQPNPVGP